MSARVQVMGVVNVTDDSFSDGGGAKAPSPKEDDPGHDSGRDKDRADPPNRG